MIRRLRNVVWALIYKVLRSSRTGGGYNSAYIGMTDRRSEGVWEGVRSGSPAPFTRWQSGAPNGGTRDNCVRIYPGYGMYDNSCTLSSPELFVCEIP